MASPSETVWMISKGGTACPQPAQRTFDGLLVPGFLEVRHGKRAGYEFQAIDGPETDQLVLLGRLIDKIRRALAVKDLEDTPEGRRIDGFIAQGVRVGRVSRRPAAAEDRRPRDHVG
jgi:hypothetical protein